MDIGTQKEARTPKIVLALVAHPDDAEWYAGGTLAKLAGEGARVIIVIATDGSKGSFELAGEALARIRAKEARRAAAALGAEPPILLGHADFELDALPAGYLREQFVRAIRTYRPDIVIAEDPFAPQEPHPDHRAVAWAAMEAVMYAGLPALYPQHLTEGLQPHIVVEKYWYANTAAGANKIVDISNTIEVKLAAMAEHRSQVQFLVEDIMRQARLAGLEGEAMFQEAAANPMAAIAWALKTQAAEVGRRIGVPFGGAFRYERFHPVVETILEREKIL